MTDCWREALPRYRDGRMKAEMALLRAANSCMPGQSDATDLTLSPLLGSDIGFRVGFKGFGRSEFSSASPMKL